MSHLVVTTYTADPNGYARYAAIYFDIAVLAGVVLLAAASLRGCQRERVSGLARPLRRQPRVPSRTAAGVIFAVSGRSGEHGKPETAVSSRQSKDGVSPITGP